MSSIFDKNLFRISKFISEAGKNRQKMGAKKELKAVAISSFDILSIDVLNVYKLFCTVVKFLCYFIGNIH